MQPHPKRLQQVFSAATLQRRKGAIHSFCPVWWLLLALALLRTAVDGWISDLDELMECWQFHVHSVTGALKLEGLCSCSRRCVFTCVFVCVCMCVCVCVPS